MSKSEFELRQVEGRELIEIARDLFREYESAIGVNLEFQNFASELAQLPEPYTPPKGALFLAFAGAEVAGCVAMRSLDRRICEMKRLYVRRAYRGWGLGEQLVNVVIQTARRAGYRELRLDTLDKMAAARKIYLRLGFTEIPAYNDTSMPGIRFFSLRLADR